MKKNKKTLFLQPNPVFFFIFILFWATAALAQENLFSMGADSEKAAWDIEARELTYDKDTDVYTAEGEVVIKRGDRVLKCDYARLDRKTMIAVTRGNVEYKAGGDELRGDQLTIDLKLQSGELEKGRLFLKKNNYHVTGDRILKTGEATYHVQGGTITSCDGEDPAWKITAKEFEVTMEGYGQLHQATFRAGNIPILYAPYLAFPAKTKRQSGLLLPEPGYSERDGAILNVPFYWAIADHMDATFYQLGMSKRGYLQGGEFRYVASPTSKGAFMADYLFKDLGSEKEFKEGRISEPYNERYWFRGKANQDLPNGFLLKVDLDWASDRDYLKEFRGIGNGMDRNRPYFLSEFGRDLDDETQLDRRNSAIVSRSFGNYNFIGGFQYFQELDKSDDALNQMPYLRFDSLRFEVWKNFFLQWYSSYNNYYRKNNDRGQVADLIPTLSYPYKLKQYLNIDTSLGVDQTFFQVDNKQSSQVSDYASRTVPNFRLDLSSDIQRIFDISSPAVQKLKHSIRPQVVYNYVPDVTQNDLPNFVTPITKINTVTYYLTNILTTKSLVGKGKEGEEIHSYLDFLYFKLYQTYDINEATRDESTPRITTPAGGLSSISTTGTTGVITTPGPRRPFSDITGEIEIVFGPNLRLRSYAGWSPYDNLISTQTHTLNLSTSGGNWVSLEYQTSGGDQFRQLNSSFFWKISPTWTANFLNRWSIDQNKNYETNVGLAYNHQCWGIKALYVETPDDRKVRVSFSLKGLGEF
ncbi:MAG: LPS-assembly protein LptD [Deltaproteobacteria bacterium]|nr:LPS-assembly protein LptD [Deltaproteobacteria bacterium]